MALYTYHSYMLHPILEHHYLNVYTYKRNVQIYYSKFQYIPLILTSIILVSPFHQATKDITALIS